MPHLTVEYTDNLPGVEPQRLLEALNASLCSHPTFSDEADVKSRVRVVGTHRIGLHPAGRAFVHAEFRLMAGRSAEVKQDLGQRIATTLQAHFPRPSDVDVQLSVDIVDMDPHSYFKGKL